MNVFPIEAIEEIIGYTFTTKDTLLQAFRMANGQRNQTTDERWKLTNAPLAYVGDALIGFLLAEHLTSNRDLKGAVPEIHDYVRKTATLAGFFQQLDIVERFREVGYPFKLHDNGVRDRGELYEALTAAIYRDGGLDAARQWLQRTMFSKMNEIAKKAKGLNPRMLIQQYCQRQYGCEPEFRIVASPANRKQNTFTVELRVAGILLSTGDEVSIKSAKNAASLQACRSLKLFKK